MLGWSSREYCSRSTCSLRPYGAYVEDLHTILPDANVTRVVSEDGERILCWRAIERLVHLRTECPTTSCFDCLFTIRLIELGEPNLERT